MRIVSAISGCILSIGLSLAAQEPPQALSGGDGYHLGPSDGVAVVVFGHDELSGKFTVAADGTLSFPLIGTIAASNRTVAQIQSELTARLGEGYLKSPRITVEIDRYASQRVYVMGEVHTPGAIPLTGPMTLLEVLARAGSLTEQAGGDIVILRGAEQSPIGPIAPGQNGTSEMGRLSVEQLRRGTVATNVSLRNGDTVFVPRAENIFVLGLVNRPGPYVFESGLTVVRALSLAGGTMALGSTGRIRVVRLVNGKRTEIKAQLDDVLKPGDTVTVGARRF